MTSPSEPNDLSATAAATATVSAESINNNNNSPELSAAEAEAAAQQALREHLSNELTVEEEFEAMRKRRVAAASGKKRNRRVGITGPRKEAKHEEEEDHSSNIRNDCGGGGSSNEYNKGQSKHDEKWDRMLDALSEYKKENNNTMVPQCYDQDPRLGRWVHYQRVEYWIYQNNGKGKITRDRIDRLASIGFEWDPQRAQWNIMYKKLQIFEKENGHSKVPKGYVKDPELANWVRNQRLEYANMERGKKTRMTTDRVNRLSKLDFKWSSSNQLRRNDNGETEESKDKSLAAAATDADTSHRSILKKPSPAKAVQEEKPVDSSPAETVASSTSRIKMQGESSVMSV